MVEFQRSTADGIETTVIGTAEPLPPAIAQGTHERHALPCGLIVCHLDGAFHDQTLIEPEPSADTIKLGFWSDRKTPTIETLTGGGWVRDAGQQLDVDWLGDKRRRFLVMPGERIGKTGVFVTREWLADRLGDQLLEMPCSPLFREDRWRGIRMTGAMAGAADKLASPLARKSGILMEAYALEFLGHAIEQCRNGEDRRTTLHLSARDKKRISEARDILDAEWSCPPTISELARRVAVNTTKLKAAFKQEYGQTIYEYITFRRMERATALLQSRNYTVTEVAMSVGFTNTSRFAAAYRRIHGHAPSDLLR